MKKNAMLKIAAVVLVAVLLTTCAISTTFAKYTTSTETAYTDARVAKWGISITAAGTDQLFLNEYEDNDVVTVKGASSKLVVAPGTANEAATAIGITIDSPEVAYKLTADVDIELAGWSASGSMYFPLKVSVDGGTTFVNLAGKTQLADIETEIEKAIIQKLLGSNVTPKASTKDGYTTGSCGEVDANPCVDGYTAPSVGTVELYWEWPFSTSAANDDNDTILGNNPNANTIEINYSVSAVQVGA